MRTRLELNYCKDRGWILDLPPLAWIQAFEASAQTLNFTRAGEALYVSQSAISQRIRLLEDRLGQDLFVRHPRSLTLTEAGRAWLPSIQDAFSKLSYGTAEVFGPEPGAPITIRATPALQHYWLAPRLAELYQRCPDLSFRVVTGVWTSDFVGDDVDIEICYGRGDWPDLVCESLGVENMVPVCSPTLGKHIESPIDLAGHTLLHATGFASGWPAWFAAAGMPAVENETRSLWFDTHIMTLRLAAANCGIALAHRRLLNTTESLVEPLAIECPTDEEFWMTRPARRSMRDAASVIWDFLLTKEPG